MSNINFSLNFDEAKLLNWAITVASSVASKELSREADGPGSSYWFELMGALEVVRDEINDQIEATMLSDDEKEQLKFEL